MSCHGCRRSQVYNALFEAKNGKIVRLCEDRAIGLDGLYEELKEFGRTCCLIGDGYKLSYDYLASREIDIILPPPHLIIQSAYGVARAAALKAEKGELTSAEDLVPVYLRLSQAERERLEKEKREMVNG
jgi:tRNA threonylcarbamoyladenosine biosynthesis protein TsaB